MCERVSAPVQGELIHSGRNRNSQHMLENPVVWLQKKASFRDTLPLMLFISKMHSLFGWHPLC